MNDNWTNPRLADEKRLVKFELWLTNELCTHIAWPAGPAGDKVLFQVREVIRAQLRVLADRGWLLDSKPLAEFLSKPIREIGEMQEKHGIANLYAYCTRKFCRYVDERAEEIQDYTNRIGHSVKRMSKEIQGIRTIPEIEAQRYKESLQARAAKERKKAARNAAREAAEQAQQTLF